MWNPIQLTKLLTGVAIGSFLLSSGLVGMQSGRGFVGELMGMVQYGKDTAAVQFNSAKQLMTPWSTYENPLDTPLLPRVLLEQIAEQTAKFHEQAAALDTNKYVKQIERTVLPYETRHGELVQSSTILWNQIQATNGFFYKARLLTLQDRVYALQQNLTEESLWNSLITPQQKRTPLQGGNFFLRRYPKAFAEVPITEYQWTTLEDLRQTEQVLGTRLQRFEEGNPEALVQEYIGFFRGTVVPQETEAIESEDSERIMALRGLLRTVTQLLRNYTDSDTILSMQLQVEGGRYFFSGSVQEDLAVVQDALQNEAGLSLLPSSLAKYIRFSLMAAPLEIRIASATNELAEIHRSRLRVALDQHQRTRLQGFQEQREFVRHLGPAAPLVTEFEDALARLEQESYVLPLADLNFVPIWLRLQDRPAAFGSLRDLRRYSRIAQAKRNVSWATLVMMGSLFMLFSTGFAAVLFTVIYLAIQIFFSLGQTVLNVVKVGEGVTGYLANKATALEQGAAVQLLDDRPRRRMKKKVHFLVEDAEQEE